MNKKIGILALIIAIIALPLIFRKEASWVDDADDNLVIITAHTEAIRREFSFAFREWYQERTGRTISLDWRVPGGTPEAVQYIDNMYLNSFRNYWENDLGRPWTHKVQAAFHNSKIVLPEDPADDSVPQAARRAFLDSEVSSGVDVFFGGGTYEIDKQAEKGQLMPLGIVGDNPPKWFTESGMPEILGGNRLWDEEGRWLASDVSSFGIIFNRDVLRELGFEKDPDDWTDLADERVLGLVALADPSKSSSINKIFEVIIEQQMHLRYKELKGLDREEREERAVKEGWERAMLLCQKIAANGRYFGDTSSKSILDVSSGACALGMAIDFYGRFQEENLKERTGGNRFGYIMPKGGSSISPAAIALLRGAPNREVALMFVEFVMTMPGQQLWGLRGGTPGGPQDSTLRCTPIIKTFYNDESIIPYRADPGLNPYENAKAFAHHPEWIEPVFRAFGFIVKTAFVDTHKELVSAWHEILRARKEGRIEDEQEALKVLRDFSRINYDEASGFIEQTLRGGNPLEEIGLHTRLTKHFRKQYKKAEEIARGKRK